MLPDLLFQLKSFDQKRFDFAKNYLPDYLKCVANLGTGVLDILIESQSKRHFYELIEEVSEILINVPNEYAYERIRFICINFSATQCFNLETLKRLQKKHIPDS